MCQFGWATEPAMWSNIIVDVSVRVFSTPISRLLVKQLTLHKVSEFQSVS